MTITIFIDADACPVKEETYKVASRHGLPTEAYPVVPGSSICSAGTDRRVEFGHRAALKTRYPVAFRLPSYGGAPYA